MTTCRAVDDDVSRSGGQWPSSRADGALLHGGTIASESSGVHPRRDFAGGEPAQSVAVDECSESESSLMASSSRKGSPHP